jgi:hypothetical protein
VSYSPTNGAGPHEPDPSDPPPVLAPPPPAVAELCVACSRYVASKYGVALDGTPETLSLVDQYVRDAREAIEERPDSIELVAGAVGAYLGEVMRQSFGAEWFSTGDHDGWRLYFNGVFLSFNPIGMAREALTLSEHAGWNAHLSLDPGDEEDVHARLSAIPQVDDEEYYLPSTRFDIVSIVVDFLLAKQRAAGLGDVRFTSEDYR